MWITVSVFPILLPFFAVKWLPLFLIQWSLPIMQKGWKFSQLWNRYSFSSVRSLSIQHYLFFYFFNELIYIIHFIAGDLQSTKIIMVHSKSRIFLQCIIAIIALLRFLYYFMASLENFLSPWRVRETYRYKKQQRISRAIK